MFLAAFDFTIDSKLEFDIPNSQQPMRKIENQMKIIKRTMRIPRI